MSRHAKPAPSNDPDRREDEPPRERIAPSPGEGNDHDALERLKQELAHAQERYLRTLAESDNARKRLQREKDEFVRFASEAVIRGLLPIIDSLDQALVAVDQQNEAPAVVKGIHLIYRQLLGLLEKEGVKRIPTIGEPFDPHRHEAVAQVETADGTPEETILEEVQVGYTMHGKVIRPAMVKVAKTSSQPSAVSSQQQSTEQQEGTSNGEGDRN